MAGVGRSQIGLTENDPQRIVPRFQLQQAYCAGEHTLMVAGELDLASAAELGEAVAHIPMDESTSLVLDVREVTFIDCAALRAILAIRELCAQQRCSFSLIRGRAQVQRLIELCKLNDRLPFGSVHSRTG